MAGNTNSGRLGRSAKMVIEDAPEFTEKCPKEFPKEAKSYWKKIVPILKERGAIQNKDIFALHRLCILKSLWTQASESVLKHGPTIDEITDRGQKVTRERIESKLLKQYGAEIDRLERNFGLTTKAGEAIKSMERKKKRVSIRDQYGKD